MLISKCIFKMKANVTDTYLHLISLSTTGHRARVFFSPIPASACDVCRAWASCARACGSTAQQVSDGTEARVTPDAAHTHVLAPVVMLIATALLLL